MNARLRVCTGLLVVATLVGMAGGGGIRASQTGMCGGQSAIIPFDDVLPLNTFFCAIAEAYFASLTNGTTTTTYSPSANVPREQMAAFITRTLDQSVLRGTRRAALNQYWTTRTANNLTTTTLGHLAVFVQSDGTDVWVAGGTSVTRVRASDGKLLDTWTGANGALSVLCARGKVFVTGSVSSGALYQLDPTQTGGPVNTLSNSLGANPEMIAYDGQRIWTANAGSPPSIPGSISIITLDPVSVTTVTTGFTSLQGIIYDGSNIWVTDDVSGTNDKLYKLDSTGAILQSVDVGNAPRYPAFDGTNIWVPNYLSNTVTVVRAVGGLAGTVMATLSGNFFNGPLQAAFDGERMLVVDNGSDPNVSIWKATDLSPLGATPTGPNTFPRALCSDGVNFWIGFGTSPGKLARL